MQFETSPNCLQRGVLAVVIFLGRNVGLGGIRTLGWQGGAADFPTVTNAPVFAVRDGHARFIGGVCLALGLLMLACMNCSPRHLPF